MPDRDLDIDEGSVSFRILSGRVDYAGKTPVRLWTGEPEGGELRIVKDEAGRITFTHLKYEEGRTRAAYGASFLDPSVPHHVEASWSVSAGTIELYLDGTKVAATKLSCA